MERIAPNLDAIADAILAAPGWARVGITAPDARLRREAAYELAGDISEAVTSETPEQDQDNQPRLAL